MDKYEKILKLWEDYNIKTETDIDLYLDSFRILFAYNSGKIENDSISYYDTRELFENGRILNYTGDPRTIFELENQRLCYEFLKSKLISKYPLSLELIKEIHFILTSGTYDERRYITKYERPGEFKKHDYIIGREEVGSSPEEVESDLNNLLEELLLFTSKDILLIGSYFHAKFEYIHPFADGNGRVGRTLLNYFLMIHNHPPLVIFDEDKNEYYFTLEHYDKTEEINLLFTFLKSQIEKTWTKTLDRSNKGKSSKKGKVL